MITYINLPKGKRDEVLKKVVSKLKKNPKFVYTSLVGFLVLIGTLTALMALTHRSRIIFLTGKPTIHSLSSAEAIPSSLVEIKGKHFGVVKPAKNLAYPGAVVFTGSDTPVENPDGVEAMIVSWSDTKITFFVPADALSGYVYVVNREDSDYLQFSNGRAFSVKKPEPRITSLSAPNSQPAELVTIKGEGLGNFMSTGKPMNGNRISTFPGRVIISENEKNKYDAVVLNWTDNQIDFYTPAAVKAGNIQVVLAYNDQEVASNELFLKVDPPQPNVAAIEKNEGLPTEVVTISGTNLGRTLTNPTGLLRFPGHVFFGKNEGLIAGWSPDAITAYVPLGVTVGVQEVKVVLDYLRDGAKSNSITFNVLTPDPKVDEASDSAFPSEAVTIKGSGFGDQISSDRLGLIFPGRVYFSPGDSSEPTKRSAQAPILSWNDTSIQVNVPVGVQAGKVFVGRATGGGDYYTKGLAFNPKVPEPQIDSLSVDKALPGQIVEIYGKNFGTQMGTTRTAITYPGRVYLNEKAALPVFGGWRDDRVVVYLPWGSKSGTLKMTLQTGNTSVTSNEKDFIVIEPKLRIDSVTIIDGDKNRVSIRGDGFGGVISNPYIGTFYPGRIYLSTNEKAEGKNTRVLGASQVEARIETWLEDKVIVTLPKNAKKGWLYVSVTGGDGVILSNGSELKQAEK